MFNRERSRQENQEPEAGAEGLGERFKRAMSAVAEQGKRISATIKERAEDTNFRRYFDNRHIRRYVRAAVIPLVLVGSYCAVRREGAPKTESRPSVVAEITPEETGSSSVFEAKTEPVAEKPLEISESEKEVAEQKAELAKEFEEFEREELEREIMGLESGAEEMPVKKESEEEKPAPEKPVPQKNIDSEMSKIDERAILEAFYFFVKDSTAVRIEENSFAVDIGGHNYHCYKITPEDLAQLKKVQEDYQAKVEKYILNRKPKFPGLLRQSFKEAAEREVKRIIRTYCQKIDEVSPEQVPEEIIKTQQERQKK